MLSFQGIFREDPWATPLLALAIITICALLLYTVIQFCSWLKPTDRRGTLPWLRLPLLLSFLILSSASLVAAVPSSLSTCRLLFLVPGIGYVFLMAGLLSRTVQHLMPSHILLQWLLLFFVILNQFIISIAYLTRSRTCVMDVNDQLILLLYPAVLVAVVLLLVYRFTRKIASKSASREAVYVGLAAAFSGAIAGCWIGAAAMLDDLLLPACLGYGCLATAITISLITLIPKQYDVEKDEMYCCHEDLYVDADKSPQTNHNGRGVVKPLPPEPEIIIVPFTPASGVPLPDIAVQALNAHDKHVHRSREQAGQPHRHRNKSSRRQSASKAQQNERNDQDKQMNKMNRTPYNHRGWLY